MRLICLQGIIVKRFSNENVIARAKSERDGRKYGEKVE